MIATNLTAPLSGADTHTTGTSDTMAISKGNKSQIINISGSFVKTLFTSLAPVFLQGKTDHKQPGQVNNVQHAHTKQKDDLEIMYRVELGNHKYTDNHVYFLHFGGCGEYSS